MRRTYEPLSVHKENQTTQSWLSSVWWLQSGTGVSPRCSRRKMPWLTGTMTNRCLDWRCLTLTVEHTPHKQHDSSIKSQSLAQVLRMTAIIHLQPTVHDGTIKSKIKPQHCYIEYRIVFYFTLICELPMMVETWFAQNPKSVLHSLSSCNRP